MSKPVRLSNLIPSLKMGRLAATPSFLQTDDVTAHLLVHAEDPSCSALAVLAFHSHRPHIVGSGDELRPASAVSVFARLSSCCAPSCSAFAPPLPGKNFPVFRIFQHILVSSISCPRLRLMFGSLEEGSALPPLVDSLILHTQAKSGAYLRAPVLPPAFRDIY